MWITAEKQRVPTSSGSHVLQMGGGEQNLCNPTFWTYSTALLLLTKSKSSFKESGLHISQQTDTSTPDLALFSEHVLICFGYDCTCMWGGHREHISECKVNPSLEWHLLASKLVGGREAVEALTFCLHRTGAVYFHREEIVLDTAKKRALLCSGFSELALFGDTDSELLLQNLSYPQSSW